MEAIISQLVQQFEDGRLTRRQLVQRLAAGVAAVAGSASGAAAQVQQAGGFRVTNLDHMNYDVTDYGRTRDFYAGLLGMTVVNDDGQRACELHFGDARGVGVRDRAMISIRTAPVARLDHFAFRIADWDTARVQAELERRGLKGRLARGG
jgi:hypothetical protein